MNIEIGVKNKRIILMGSCGVLGKMHAKILCENGADSTIKDLEGKTAIELAKDEAVKAALAACASSGGRRKMTRRRKMKRNGKGGNKSKRSKRSKRSKSK